MYDNEPWEEEPRGPSGWLVLAALAAIVVGSFAGWLLGIAVGG